MVFSGRRRPTWPGRENITRDVTLGTYQVLGLRLLTPLMPPSLPSLLPSQPALHDRKRVQLLSRLTFLTLRSHHDPRATPDCPQSWQSHVSRAVSPLHTRCSSWLIFFRTPIFICAFKGTLYHSSPLQAPSLLTAIPDCNRLYPTRDRVMLHRKRDHSGSVDDSLIITWNE